MERLSNTTRVWESQHLLYSDPLSLKPLPLQTLPFQLLSLHLESLSLPEEVLPLFALPAFTFCYFPSPWGKQRLSETSCKDFSPVLMCEHSSTLPAYFCGATDTFHPLTHSLFFHLLERQDVLSFVGKGTLFVFHHLKLRQAGDTRVLKRANWQNSKLHAVWYTILGGINHFGLLCSATLTKGWKKGS